jgi:uncharacterized membrane protein YebE (DUF533 family)
VAEESNNEQVRRGGHERELHRILAQKVLYGHVQNRNQLIDQGLANLHGLDPADGVLLIRAMAAAAHADGGLEIREHDIIAGALNSLELDAAARRQLEQEIDEPPCLEALARQVQSTQMASRFYAVSLRVLDRHNNIHLAYLRYLAQRLGVPGDVIVRLNRRFGLRP